jgi:hypothetical protein|tara:strand:- start:522 stop:704 length:183 start_codon:yes stop_codon:yes gene_type:complete
MTDKLTNPVTVHLDDKLYKFVKLTVEHTGTDLSAVIRLALQDKYNEKMRDLNLYQPLLEE